MKICVVDMYIMITDEDWGNIMGDKTVEKSTDFVIHFFTKNIEKKKIFFKSIRIMSTKIVKLLNISEQRRLYKKITDILSKHPHKYSGRVYKPRSKHAANPNYYKNILKYILKRDKLKKSLHLELKNKFRDIEKHANLLRSNVLHDLVMEGIYKSFDIIDLLDFNLETTHIQDIPIEHSTPIDIHTARANREVLHRQGDIPVKIEKGISDEYNGIITTTYRIEADENVALSDDLLYNTIIDKIPEDAKGRAMVKIQFTQKNDDGSIERFYRMFKPSKIDTYNHFMEAIDHVYTEGEPSFVPDTGKSTDITNFSITTVNSNIIGRGGREKTIFAINNYKVIDKKALCLWNSVFSILGIMDEKIDKKIILFSEMEDKLINLYGYSIKLYSDMCILPKLNEIKCEEIKYDDGVISGCRFNADKLITLKEAKTDKFIELVYFNEHYIPFSGIKTGSFSIDWTLNINHIEDNKLINKIKRNKIETRLLDCNAPLLKDGVMYSKEENDTAIEELKKDYDHIFEIKKEKEDFNELAYKHVRGIKKDDSDVLIIAFDVETVFDEKELSILKTYSVSWVCNDKAYFYFGDDCIEKLIDFTIEVGRNKRVCLLGYNSSRFDNMFLIPTLLDRELLNDVFYQKSSILNVTFCGRHTVHDICRFTNCSLKQACSDFKTKYIKRGDFNHEHVQNHFIKNNNTHSFFHDLDCINNNKILSFNIDEPDALIKTIEENSGCKCKAYTNLVVYNIFDVLSTRELYEKIEEVCKTTQVIKEESFLVDHKTIGGLIYKKFAEINRKKSLAAKDNNLKLPLPTIERYFDIRNGLVAGRTQCYKGVKFSSCKDITKKYAMIDVKSLYPFAALNRLYPTGEIIECNRHFGYEWCVKNNKIGFFYCLINQSNIYDRSGRRINVLPRRVKGEVLDWTYDGDMIMFIVTVDIKCILDYGGKVEVLKRNDKRLIEYKKLNGDDNVIKPSMNIPIIDKDFANKIESHQNIDKMIKELGKSKKMKKREKETNKRLGGNDPIHVNKKELDPEGDDGIFFTGTADGKEVFSCLEDFKRIKENEDVKKAKGEEFNPVLRNMAKLFLNSLTGKVIERLHTEKKSFIRNAKDLQHLVHTETPKGISCIYPSVIFNKNAGIISYDVTAESVFKKDRRPLYLGCLIYAYSREHMFRSVLHDYKVLYQDTDSALISVKQLELMKKEKPEMFGGNFGQFEEEPGSGNYTRYVTIAPKNYFIYGVDHKNPQEEILYKKGFKGINLKQDKLIEDINDPLIKKYVNTHTHKSGEKSYTIKNAYELYTSNILKTVYENTNKFVELMKRDGYTYILSSSLIKPQSTSSTGRQSGAIHQSFTLKKTLCKKELNIEKKKSNIML